ncbi:MAG: uracil-DNA glycosylase [Burkholderiales bacterium]|nr:uracil-DNA glycosylase [Burkholderiales bacterium]
MLREMGLKLLAPAGEPVPGGAPPAPVAVPVASPGSDRAGPSGEASAPPAPQRPAVPVAAASAPRAEGQAVVSPVAGLDWPALRDAVANCRACTLCESRTQTVFGVGHERAHWMIVGEAPGEQEDLRGEPFVGAAGRLLDRMLLALGLTRAPAAPNQQVYIANTLKCRPPRNRNPAPEELQRCQPFLERQVELVQPRIILAMGRFAVQSLLASTEPIGRLRGQVHTWRGRPLVVTYHPAYLLRSPADKARAWADLCLAAHVADQAGDRVPTPSDTGA